MNLKLPAAVVSRIITNVHESFEYPISGRSQTCFFWKMNCTGANLDITSVRNDLETGNSQELHGVSNLTKLPIWSNLETLHIYYWVLNSFVFHFAITLLYCPLSKIRIAVSFQCLFGRMFPWYQHWAPCSQHFAAALPGTPGIHAEAEGQIWWVPGCLGQYRVWKLTIVCDGRVDILKCDEVCWSPAPTFFVGWFLVFINKPDWTPQGPKIFTSCRGCWSLKHQAPNQWSPKPRLMSSASSLLMSLRNLQPKLSLHARRNLLRRQRHAVDGI